MFIPEDQRPVYEHQEYPKAIFFPDGKHKVAANAEEEAEIRGTLPVIATLNDVLQVDNVSDDEFKAVLLKIAGKFGVHVDKRWKFERIVDAILAVGEEVKVEAQTEKEE